MSIQQNTVIVSVINQKGGVGKTTSSVNLAAAFAEAGLNVLVLDDIGAESITQWTRDEILLPVLDERMNKGMKTYFTSNYSMEELEQQYRLVNKPNNTIASLRILERIRTLSKPVELSGKSRR